jgi:tight adherence protein C
MGAVLGLVFGVGVLLFVSSVVSARRTPLGLRVQPWLADLPTRSGNPRPVAATSALGGLVGPVVQRLAGSLERVLGGTESIRRRLVRADLDLTVHDFRVRQALWGLIAFVATAVPAGMISLASPQRAVPLLICCCVAAALGVLLCENHLSALVARRERDVLAEFPTVAELLALAVAAGEAPAAALARVTERSHGALSSDLARLLAAVRTGTPLVTAFDDMAARSGLPVVSRFAEGMAIAIERGTPLTEVLHAQAADVREASRRALIETGARKEVAMMVPVVFIVLPVVIVFAFYPGLIGLRIVV